MAFKYSLLTLGVLSVSALAIQAHAQGGVSPAASFHPVQGWAASGSGGSGCALNSTYNNGFDVSFGGQAKILESLNVNFQQDIFEAGKTYDVGFRIPGSIPQKFSANAVSASALNINVGGSPNLLSALHSASAFDLNVEGNDFRFFLTGFAAGAKGFDQCLGVAPGALPVPVLQQVAVPPEEGKAPPPPVLDNKTVANMSDQLIVPVTEIYPEDKMKLTPTPAGTRMSDKIAKEIERNPEAVKINNQPLPDDSGIIVKMVETPPDAPQEKPKAILTKPEAKLQMNMESNAADAALKPEDKIAFNDEVPAEPAPVTPVVVHKETPAPVVTHNSDKPEVIDFSKYDETEPSANGSTLRKADPDMLRKISELEGMIHKLKAENAALSSDFSDNVRETEEERLSISSDNWNLERATMRYNEAEREVKRLGQQLQKERASCTLEKQDLEAQLFDPQVASQQQVAKLADLEGKLDKAKAEMETQRQFYEERIRILEDKTAQ